MFITKIIFKLLYVSVLLFYYNFFYFPVTPCSHFISLITLFICSDSMFPWTFQSTTDSSLCDDVLFPSLLSSSYNPPSNNQSLLPLSSDSVDLGNFPSLPSFTSLQNEVTRMDIDDIDLVCFFILFIYKSGSIKRKIFHLTSLFIIFILFIHAKILFY